jgi:hypothetical protein
MNRCADCHHIEDDHDGYGGMCDGLLTEAASREEWNDLMDARAMCGCTNFREKESK